MSCHKHVPVQISQEEIEEYYRMNVLYGVPIPARILKEMKQKKRALISISK